MTQKFENRVYGCSIVRSINSNFNADFTHAPRTLPDGVVYATDKALKYAIKDYLRKNYAGSEGNYVLYIKRFNDELVPFNLEEAYDKMVAAQSETIKAIPETQKKDKGLNKFVTMYNLFKCIDIRLFGATFAKQSKTDPVNLSVHGPVQISHGINKFTENVIYTEDILSPFRTGTDDEKNQNSTIGNQTNLREGHYVYHFTVNPLNLEEYYKLLEEKEFSGKKLEPEFLSADDISKFKEALNRAVTYLDSSRKIGSENEFNLFVTLKKGSLKVLPNFSELVSVKRDNNNMVLIDATKVGAVLRDIRTEIENIELYFNPVHTVVTGLDDLSLLKFNILTSEQLR